MMQNKSNRKIEDQGWKSMQVILDQEMPVEEKPKRRFLFWYWMGGIAATMVGLLFFINFHSFEGKGRLDTDIAERTEKKTNPTTITDVKPITIISDDQIVDSKIKMNLDAQSKTEENKEIAKTTNQLPTSKEKTFIHKEDKQPFQMHEATVFHQSEKLTVIEKPAPAINETEISSKIEKVTEVHKLPILTSIIDVENNKPKFQFSETRKIEPAKKQKTKVQWAFSANSLVTKEPRVNGISSGVKVQIPLSKKFSLESGLNYRFVNHKFIEITESASERLVWGSQHNGSVGTDPDSVISITDLVPSAIQNSSNKNYEYTRKGYYHYIALPLNLNYSLSKSSTIQVGIEGSYLLNRDQSSSNLDALLIANDNNDPSFSYEFSGAVNQVKRLDMGVNIGYRYQIGTKWAMNASYHHGNLIQRNEWRVNNRFFRLGTQYNF